MRTLHLFVVIVYLSREGGALNFPLLQQQLLRRLGQSQSRPRSSRLCSLSDVDSAQLATDMMAATSSPNPPLQPLAVEPLFASLSTNRIFLDSVWQKRPFLCQLPLPNLVNAFTMANVQQCVDSDFLEAGRGTVLDTGGGWNMASVSTPRGSSFEDAKLRFEDVQMAMKKTSGTVVFNSAGGFIPALAGVCLETVTAFDIPAALNMYLTDPGQKLSAPPHTDRQEVFVLQTQGQKRWRVYSPPNVNSAPRSDPFARGKGKDALTLDMLGQPLLDTVLHPGQVLYIPAGYPHTTDTLEGVSSSDPSVHLTVGLDAHVWGLSYAGLRSYALRRSGLESELNLAKVDPAAYWQLQESLPLGFLSEDIIREHKGFGSAMRTALSSTIISRLIERMRQAEPARWPASLSDEQLASQINADEAVSRILTHHRAITETLGKMYADVAFKISPAQRDLSFFRSQPYFQLLEATATDLEKWASPQTKKAEQGAKKGFGAGTAAASSSGRKKGFGA